MPGTDPPAPEAVPAQELGTRHARFGGRWRDTRLVGPGTGEVEGPAILALPGSTLVVPPGWSARAGAEAVVMER